jgi:hypothetical protein
MVINWKGRRIKRAYSVKNRHQNIVVDIASTQYEIGNSFQQNGMQKLYPLDREVNLELYQNELCHMYPRRTLIILFKIICGADILL